MRQKISDIIDGIRKPKRYADPARTDSRAQFEVDTWIISDFLLREVIPLVGHSPYPLNELILMVASIVWIKPEYIFEWGTHVGKSARIFSETAEHFDLSTHIYSIDLPDDVVHAEHPGRQRGIFVHGRKNVTLLQGDGLDTALSLFQRLGHHHRALFFLDGDHSYRSVLRELREISKQSPRGNILIHDTFYQSAVAGYNIGPYQAIVKFLSKRKHTYEKLVTNTGLPGITLLYTRP